MTEAMHWIAYGRSINEASGELVATVNPEQRKGENPGQASLRCETTARLIVRAVNAHEELVNALSTLVEKENRALAFDAHDWTAARAALKRARGEASPQNVSKKKTNNPRECGHGNHDDDYVTHTDQFGEEYPACPICGERLDL